jgi:uncharacterized low-complexity protein
MNNQTQMKRIAILVGTTFTAAAALPATAMADTSNPFEMQDLDGGYAVMSKASAEGKCGEGKCGEGETKASGEGKCGEGKCGAGESKASGEGKCGEGKCGAGESKASGEGKCGA